MPKATTHSIPLNGLLPIMKPSGPPSMQCLNDLQPLFSSSSLFESSRVKWKSRQRGGSRNQVKSQRSDKVKMGQGGTLDPLASGVLVLGIGNGTKELQRFINCEKTYRATALLGCATTEYDSKGKKTKLAPFSHVTQGSVEAVLDRFRGKVEQYPPVYSAIKMDGKALHDYARSGEPLPRAIQPRSCTISELEVEEWLDADKHSYEHPTAELSEDERKSQRAIESLMEATVPVVTPEANSEPPEDHRSGARPPAFTLRMTVSSGTYVRSIVHDIGIALGSAAHVVMLERTRQGEFGLDDCVPWPVFEAAMSEDADPKADESEYRAWEQEVLSRFKSAVKTDTSNDVD